MGGGSAAPGLYAINLCPNIIADLASQIESNVVITGTNGKTTTTRLLSHFARSSEMKIIRNQTGSNLQRGIASALIEYSSLTGKIKADLGIWEIDEAAFNVLLPQINPKIVIFLNVSRDQLDRYGEVDSVVKKWHESVKKLPKNALLILNGDDQNVTNLSKSFAGKSVTFGLKKHNFAATNIKTKSLSGVSFQLTIDHKPQTINLPIPGIYHIYDFLAAFAAGYSLNIDLRRMVDSLKSYKSAFGRVEKFTITHPVWRANWKAKDGYIFLIKNPAGATAVFGTLAKELRKEDTLLIALNDNLADGTDVSWIWDADFETFQNQSRAKSRDYNIIVSGSRAEDLAVRLKYAGFSSSNLEIQKSLTKAFHVSLKALKGRLFILPTYTAMLEIQNILTKQGIKKHYWKDI